jgi:hypothetical protein
MKQHEQALLYLQKAAEDEVLLDEVLDSIRISDSVIGFHCQQAVEKLLKALLSFKAIRFRRTHDIVELIDLLADNDHPLPEHLSSLDYFTPYAVEFRYELFPLAAEEGLDRQSARVLVAQLRSWVEAQMHLKKV